MTFSLFIKADEEVDQAKRFFQVNSQNGRKSVLKTQKEKSSLLNNRKTKEKILMCSLYQERKSFRAKETYHGAPLVGTWGKPAGKLCIETLLELHWKFLPILEETAKPEQMESSGSALVLQHLMNLQQRDFGDGKEEISAILSPLCILVHKPLVRTEDKKKYKLLLEYQTHHPTAPSPFPGSRIQLQNPGD